MLQTQDPNGPEQSGPFAVLGSLAGVAAPLGLERWTGDRGVGACVAANKVDVVRAALITDTFSAHQGVQDDDNNIICLGGRVTGYALSWDLVQTFFNARFKGGERFRRRLEKVAELENDVDSQ